MKRIDPNKAVLGANLFDNLDASLGGDLRIKLAKNIRISLENSSGDRLYLSLGVSLIRKLNSEK